MAEGAAAVPVQRRLADGELPLVSVVVACRNERQYIERCLRSLLEVDYPAHRLEILVVDGRSDDGTVALLEGLAASEPRLRLIDNPGRTAPAAFNLGIAAASGTVILIAGSHSHYPPGYVRVLVNWLVGSGADVVGAVCRTDAANSAVLARAIAGAMSHPFGVGNSHFRIGVGEPRWVDTVPFGCYRRDVFERIGGFDEELVRNQDDELNLRLGRSGGRLLLIPDVSPSYQARDSLGKLWRMYWQYGYYKPLVVRKLGGVFTMRQLVPALFVVALAVSLIAAVMRMTIWPLAMVGGAYLVASGIAAVVARRHGWRVALVMPAAFTVMHLAYGAGFVRGTVRFLLARRGAPMAPVQLPLSR